MKMPYAAHCIVALAIFVSSARPVQAAGELGAVVGYLDNDVSPATGIVTTWDSAALVALGENHRSVALDFGAPQRVHTIRLRDSDDASRTGAADLTVWHSDDNVSYTQATGWTLASQVLDGRLVHTLRGPAFTARYVKVASALADPSPTFLLQRLQEDICAHSVTVGLLNNDNDPATGSVLSWGGTASVALDYQRRSVVLDFSTVQRVGHVRLSDSNDATRVAAANYTVWRSNDNVTYTEVRGWSWVSRLAEGRIVHTLVGLDFEARYVKINTTFSDTAYTFVLSNLQEDVSALAPASRDTGVAIHSDGDRLFPPGASNLGSPADVVRDTIIAEVNALADAGFRTLKMGMGTDVVNWPSTAGSSRDWRLDDPVWALSAEAWSTYADLRGRALTARNLFSAGLDPLAIAGRQARLRGMQFIISFRVADTHFTVNPTGFPLTSKFYLDGEASAVASERVAIKHDGRSPVPGYVNFDRLMNMDRENVRTHRLRVLLEAIERYKDVADGLELEFTRSVALFPFGQGAAKAHLITAFIQDVRDGIHQLEAGSALRVLGLRVPSDQGVGANQGLDTDALIAARLVDYIVPSTVMTVPHDMDIRSWVAAARPAHPFDPGVAIYAGLPARKPSGWTFPLEYGNPAAYVLATGAENEHHYGAARAFFKMGGDGIEIYNFAAGVASSSGRKRLQALVTNLDHAADVGKERRIFAVTPRWTKPYEGRLEHVKKLPAEFRSNGTVWVNSVDGSLVQQSGNRHLSAIYLAGVEARPVDETWLFRIGIRALSGQALDLTALSLRVLLNGVVLWDGLIQGAQPATLVAVGNPTSPPAFPAPTHYLTIPIAPNFPLTEGEFNAVAIEQNAVDGGRPGFGLQEIQIGAFPRASVTVEEPGSAPWIAIAGLSLTHDGRIEFAVAGPAGLDYEVERSRDLTEWESIAWGTVTVPPSVFTEPLELVSDVRFYRVRSVPPS